jgi:hypothetical protein
MARHRHPKAIKPRPQPVAPSVRDLLEPRRQESGARVLSLSELDEAIRANRRRRKRESPVGGGADAPPSSPSAVDLLGEVLPR